MQPAPSATFYWRHEPELAELYGMIGDEEIPSQENRLIIFDNAPLYGTAQTDTDTRVILNYSLRHE